MARLAAMDDQQLGALIRAVRIRRGLRQSDLAEMSGLSRAGISLIERGHWQKLSIDAIRRVTGPIDIRVEVRGRWRGAEADRLLGREHSLLADSFATFVARFPGWLFLPEVSFSTWGERGVIDSFGFHAGSSQLAVFELKTEFGDMNETIGVLDRKTRLALSIGRERGWQATGTSTWLIVSDTKTNRRHAFQHQALLASRFELDGRALRGFLADPSKPTTGLAFWTNANGGSRSPGSVGGRQPGSGPSASRRAAPIDSRLRRSSSARFKPDPAL